MNRNRRLKKSIKMSGILIILMAALLVPPAAAKAVPAPYTPPVPFAPPVVPSPGEQFDITGFIQEATLDPAGVAGDALAGGTLKVNGHLIIVPRNTIVIMPATALTWQEIFAKAPAPYGLTTAAGTPETGLALNDIPRPFATYEVEVVGNHIVTPTSNLYIAGLIYLSPEFLNSGQGYINFIDYANATMWVGSKLAVPMTGTRLQINDPPIINGAGRYSKGLSPDVRFTVDVDNPTITARSAYPMGLPEFLNDPKRPERNRPVDTNPASPGFGHFLSIYTMTDIANLTNGTSAGPNICSTCDPRLQVPFEVGDFITFSGLLVHDGINPTAMPAPGTPNTTYISATSIETELGVYTFPGSDPAYVRTDVFILGTAGTPVVGFVEAGKRDRFEGFSTDPSRNVHLFGIDVDFTGATFDRDWGSVDVDPGPPSGAQRGRWRFRPPTNVLTLPPAGVLPPTKNGGLRRLTQAESFLPPTREVRAVISKGEVAGNSLAPFTLNTEPIAANGIKSGQYHAPILEYIFPENLIGTPMIQNNFADFPFLFDGGYSSAAGVVGEMLYPFPAIWDAAQGAVPPYIPAFNSVFVRLANATVAVNGTEMLNALPLDQLGVPFTPITPVDVTFASSNPAVATVNATTGLVTGVFPGTAIVTATASNGTASFSATAAITVIAPVDTFNITVQSPPGAIAATNVSSISLVQGTSGTVLLSVMSAAPGSYVVNATASSANFTSAVAMTVIGASAQTTGVNTIATYLLNVTNTGIPAFIGNSVTITTATTVTGVYPSIAMLLPLEAVQFTSTDPGVNWISSNGTVGTISPTGLFNASAAGNTTITAANGTAVVGTALVIVGAARYTTPPLLAGYNQIIVPVQSDPAFNASRLLQLVTGQNRGVAGSKAVRFNATSQLFETYDPFAGLIDFTIDAGQGYFVNFTAPAPNMSIVGTLTGITRPQPVIGTITVAPSNPALVAGSNQPFVATALDLMGDPIAAAFIWNSSNTTVGTINITTGVFTALAAGTARINATNGSIVGSASVTVSAQPPAPSVPTTINVTPANAAPVAGSTQTFTAAPLDQFGNPIASPVTVTWISSNTTVGAIDAAGVFAAKTAGNALVLAIHGSVVGSAAVTVSPAPPANGTIAGMVTDAVSTAAVSGATVTAGGVIATTDAAGNYSISIAPGTYTVTATATGLVTQSATGVAVTSGATATRNFALSPVTVLTTITVTPATATVANTTGTQVFNATARDQNGILMPGITIDWTISNPAVVGTAKSAAGITDASGNVTTAFNASVPGITFVNATSAANVSAFGRANVTVI